MTTLVVTGLVNVGIGLALNYLFPPPGVRQEGPRLANRAVSSSAHGTPIPVTFGTDRVPAQIVWALPIIEKRHKETVGGKKGGGQKSTAITYTYFLTCTLSFGIAGADQILRLWADGKLIYDRVSSEEETEKGGIDLKFHYGGATQQPDAIEAAELGEENTPAYRHLTRVRLNELPLADYGNRPPNFTAEIAYDAANSFPFGGTFPGAFTINNPGSATESTLDYMAVDRLINSYFGLTDNANGMWRADLTTGQILAVYAPGSGFIRPGYGWGKILTVDDTANNTTNPKLVNALTMVLEETAGFTVSNAGDLALIRVGDPVLGFQLVGVKGGNSLTANSRAFLCDPFVDLGEFNTVSSVGSETHVMIPDDERGFNSQRLYFVASVGSLQQVTSMEFERGIVPGGSVQTQFSFVPRGTFQFPSGGNLTEGWAVDAATGYLHLSNSASRVIYDPETQTVVTSKVMTPFHGHNNYIRGPLFASARGLTTTGTITVVDSRTLAVIATIATGNNLFSAGNRALHDESCVWEPETRRVIFSRDASGQTGIGHPEIIVRVFVDRADANLVGLDFVVQSLCTQYLDQPMGNLDITDIDVTDLASETVVGFTLNQQGTVRDAIDQLRQAYLFDGVQSDWTLKFVRRGKSPVLTIPEEHVGFRGASDGRPVVQEVRTQEAELPMRVNIRYRNQDVDYSPDVEHVKRIHRPTPAIAFEEEKTVELAVVFDTGAVPKQVAEKWLYTMWNERRRYSTGLPWAYIRLEPTDVFLMGLFGETIQARLTDEDIGANLALEVEAVREQAFTFLSTIAASGSPGFITQQVPNLRATKVIFLDTPLLATADLNLGTLSNAYVAMGSYSAQWPGALLYSSQNETTWDERATANVDMAWGVVTTPPSAVTHGDCGDYFNHFQEVEDGGSMIVVVQQRPESFDDATELEVFNGANAIAVVTSAGVEIIQFQDVVVINPDQPNRLRLERLLRNRLGTEDVSEANAMAAGDEFVLLRGQIDTTEEGAVVASDLPFADVGQELLYRAVTIGTLLESAPSLPFTYTGRDLKPYSPVQITVVAGTPDGLTVSWTNRNRLSQGPLGETTGNALNESIEQYDVEIDDGGTVVTKVVNDAKTVNFSDAELAALFSGDPTMIGVARVRQVSGTGLKSPFTECSFEV